MQKEQSFLSLMVKPLLFFLAFFTCIQVWAQDDDSNSLARDTVKWITTDSKAGDVKYEESDTHYFLKKDQFSRSNDSLQIRTVPGSWVKKLKTDNDYWYADAEIKKKKKEQLDPTFIPLGQRTWFKTLLWLLIIGGFAAFIIWYLAGNDVSIFKKRQRLAEDKEDEMDTEDIFAINYQKEIDKASKMGNYRLAIRLMFLRLLKDLSQKNIIQYAQGKTNFDYLMQLHPTKYYRDFFRITRNYEYSWYGQFDVTEDMYHIIRSDFNNFDRQLR